MAKIPDVGYFEPYPDLLARVRKECTTSEGLQYGDVRWWPEGGCLAVWELRQNMQTWIVITALRDEKGQPRNLRSADVEDIKASLAEARRAFDSHWYEKAVLEHNAEVDARAMKACKDEIAIARGVAQEKARKGMCMHGMRGDVDCYSCQVGKWQVDEERKAKTKRVRGIAVTDRRRRFARGRT